MRKSLFCLFLFVIALPAFSGDEFTVDTQIAWNGDVVADAIRSVDLDQDTSNKILVDLLLDRNTFSVGDAVGECKKHCNQLSQPSQDFCPTVCENFATNLVTINNERAEKSANCPEGTFNIGFKDCVNPLLIDGKRMGYVSDDRYGVHMLNNKEYGLNEYDSWAAEFSNGTIKGISMCSNDRGNNERFTWSNESSNWLRPALKGTRTVIFGEYCWCQMTSPSASGWVFITELGVRSCLEDCAKRCGEFLLMSSDFRAAIFSSVKR